MVKYRIAKKGQQFLRERMSDPVFKEEFSKIEQKMAEVLPRLLNLTEKELFDEIFDGLRKEDK